MMKEDVRWPSIPYEEYCRRIDRAKECLVEHEIDAMVLFGPDNLWYYGGMYDILVCGPRWRTSLIISQEHDPVFIIDAGLSISLTCTSWVEDVRTFSDSKHPIVTARRTGVTFFEVLFDTLRKMGLIEKHIGLETGPDILSYLSIDEYEMLRVKLQKVMPADSAIWKQRMIKSPYEQELIREGFRRACLCVRAAFDTIRPGVTDREIHKVFWEKAVDLDMVEAPYKVFWLCLPTSQDEMLGGFRGITGPQDRVVKPGDFGFCDGGPQYKMYRMDFQRSFCVGQPHERTLYYHNIATEAYSETIKHLRPGVKACDLFKLSVEELRRRDYEYGHTITFIGHGEGLSMHEPPWITAEEEMELAPGMIIAIEMGALDPEGRYFGGFPEDVFLINETGAENLTSHLSHELYVAEI